MPTGDGPPVFLTVPPITQVHLAALTERVRYRAIRWFRLTRLREARPPTVVSSSRPHDERNVFQASPDELPVIDIHSL